MYIRFFNPNDTIEYTPDRPAEDYIAGPFLMESVQGTYQEIRAGDDGDTLAWLDPERGQWRVYDPAAVQADGQWHDVRESLGVAGYSDWELTEVAH